MPGRRLPPALPPGLDALVAALGRMAEALVDGAARAVESTILQAPAFQDLSEREKKALAYAIVGDLLVSPIPAPLDAPLDVVVQERIRQHMPEVEKYRRMATKAAEALPYLELLPNYIITVMATIREREGALAG